MKREDATPEDLGDEGLPPPRDLIPYSERQLIGREFIVPMRLVPAAIEGFMGMIQDVYVAREDGWRLKGRYRTWSRASCECDECAAGQALYPTGKPEELLTT